METTTTSTWRSSLAQDSRQKIVKRIMDTLQRHMPVAGQDGVEELLKIAWRFEEKIFQAATDQQDYLHKISLKILALETKANGNALQARGAGGVAGQVAIKPDPAGDAFAGANVKREGESKTEDNTQLDLEGLVIC